MCNIKKDLTSFYRRSNGNYRAECKECRAKKDSEKYWKDRKPYQRQIHPDVGTPEYKEYRRACSKKWREENDEYKKQKAKEYYELNKESIRAKNSEYAKNNAAKITKRGNEYALKRRNTDPIYRLKYNMRCRLHKFLSKKGFKKNTKTLQMIGCSWEELVNHIEKQFQPGMTWDNYGEWHIDHIIPLASAKTEDQVYKLNHYSNLQPLWAIDNQKKWKL